RVSDSDRESVAGELRDHFAAGRLSEGELSDRLGAAYSAKTAAELSALRAGQLVLDATVPLAAAVSGKATRMLGVWQGSAAQQAQEMVPDGVTVIAGLHTVSAGPLADLAHALNEDVLICGDRRDDKARVAALIGSIDGLRVVDCGRLEMARITESLTALLISINARYKTHAGLRVSGLPDTLW
ncbi:MAG TPA: DUF1707 domain-containing protein, partial [Solirubrobacteraceae bacterium]|nr:DUF1707 domain-containing protein [Solirubrobacteraceae bacterium]